MNIIRFEYKDISTYRSELMGWAIIWIMMLHFTFTQITPLGFVAQYGFAGVDIFMLVSGFGLFFSLDKNPNISQYYQRRILRIFPTYFFLGIFASLIVFHDSILTYLIRYTTIGFWTGIPYWEWYIPTIISFYLIAPFIKLLIDKRKHITLSTILTIILLSAFYVVAKDIFEAKDPHFFMLYRFPAFVFGMLCAYWMKNEASKMYYYSILAIGIPCFVFLFPHHHEIYNYKYFSLLFLLPVFAFIFIFISKCIKKINPIISHIGKASLEVYLIQCIFFNLIIDGRFIVPSAWHDTITFALILVSSILGILTHWLINRLTNRFFS
ncbi:acyltransferase [Prevotella communis]|uniref:acyltransferase family protein n=1 Tax=Prevotella communis TaxID=2913614 RepID=UPI001EDB296C|nr:acyltransferase [Prevotella communis]UKK61058.1 acyltransferase [Prevotella communis]UKK63883.1 acyltransferase [Prevotella communis]